MRNIIATMTSCLIALTPALALSQSGGDEGPLSATLSVGYESNDNVTTSELHTSSGISDEAMVVDFGLALSQRRGVDFIFNTDLDWLHLLA